MNDVSKPLMNFLDYVDGRQPADELMQEIDEEIDIAKRCDEWRRDYMTFALELEKYKEYGIEEGRAEGKAEERFAAIKNIMETMNLTARQAMQALKIPANEYDKYLVMLE